jgi:hypothetical protein
MMPNKDNLLKDITKTLESIFEAIPEWNIDRNTLFNVRGPENPDDRFIDLNKVGNNIPKLIKPFIPICQLCQQYNALWTILDLQNIFTRDYPYYVIYQNISEGNKDTLKKFLIYPSSYFNHFENNLLDLSRLVLGESSKLITPIIIHKPEIINIEDYKFLRSLNLSKNIIQKFSLNYFITKVTSNEIHDLIEQFSKSFDENNAKCLWNYAKEKWPDIENRAKNNKWENYQRRFANYIFWLLLQNDEWNYYLYIPGVIKKDDKYFTAGGLAIAFKEMLPPELYFTLYGFISHLLEKWSRGYSELMLYFISLQSSASSILTESYAHNIGAHGLEGLKIELIDQWENVKKSILNSDRQESLIQIRSDLINEMRIIDNDIKSIIRTHSNFPEYLNYLQGKSAFWASISRGGHLIGGIITNVWELINDFAKNNLLCGSLGASEGYKGIEFFINYIDNNEQKNNEFICLGRSTMEDDLRFRFEEEDILGGNYEFAYTQRTGSKLEKEKLEELEKLKDKLEKLEIFLPEGIVGKQAVYTIWENIIRNVKHCIKPHNNDYIPFYFEINNNENEEWIRINNWIDLDAGDSKTLNEKVEQMNSWEGIIDKDNKPNMGGTSQNILCAGMVFAQSFIKTQELQKSQNKIIDFTLHNNRIKYSFKVWKGRNIETFENIKNQKNSGFSQPMGRFRIIKVKNDEEEKELLSKEYFLRYVRVYGNSDFDEIYKKWIEKWIEIDKNNVLIKADKWGNVYFKNTERQDDTNRQPKSYNYYFYHENPNKIKSKIYINYKINDKIGSIIHNSSKSGKNLELYELLKIKIEIFDKRIKKLAEKEKFKIRPDLNSLNLSVYGEENDSIPKVSDYKRKHYGIFHLSFLETITGCQNSEAIKEFFNNKYIYLKDRYKIIFITSGRGRKWWDGLCDTPELKQKIKYLSIENLEYCFEKAEYFAPKTPAIGAKYALVKIIFGS